MKFRFLYPEISEHFFFLSEYETKSDRNFKFIVKTIYFFIRHWREDVSLCVWKSLIIHSFDVSMEIFLTLLSHCWLLLEVHS